MRLHLIENAIDSLTFGKDFYQKYFDLGDDKYLSEKSGFAPTNKELKL